MAEVASTVNENLLIKYLLKNAKSDEEKIYLLNYYLEQFRTTVYRQTLFAEFEKISHERVEAGQPMTAKDFTEIYYDLNKLYYGGSCNVDELVGIEWARIPHLNEEGAVPRYIEFLRSGGSEYPLDQLRHAGVNMEEKSAVDGALKVFADLVDELEALISK